MNNTKTSLNEKSQYKPYISGLKGFACIMVMVGHYLGLFRYAEEVPNQISLLNKLFSSKAGFVISESFWLYLFFVVSGYLAAQSSIRKFREFIEKCILRFLRLGFPILCAYLIIYLISISVGFHNSGTANLFTNTWFQNAYEQRQYSPTDVLLSPFYVLILGKCSLNSPYWVLREMFIASAAIYLITYLRQKLPTLKKWIDLLCLGFAVFGHLISPTVSACIAGMIVCRFENVSQEFCRSRLFAFCAIGLSLTMYVLPRTQISCLFFSSLILFIPKTKIIRSLFSSKAAVFLGKISFGIYSFHWPLLCSVGALIMLSADSREQFVPCLFAAMGSCVVLTLLLSIAYNITFERLSTCLIRRIKSLFEKAR